MLRVVLFVGIFYTDEGVLDAVSERFNERYGSSQSVGYQVFRLLTVLISARENEA